MFYKEGVVISDQFHHLKFIWFRSFRRKKWEFWEFGKSGRGSPIPKNKCKNIGKFLTSCWKPKMFLLKTKNVSKVLKCKINTKKFLWIRGSQKGGGPDVWEKFPNNIVFLYESVPEPIQISLKDGFDNVKKCSQMPWNTNYFSYENPKWPNFDSFLVALFILLVPYKFWWGVLSNKKKVNFNIFSPLRQVSGSSAL